MTRTEPVAVERPWVRVVGVILTALFGVPFLLCAWLVLSARFSAGTTDPHGYVVIFGTLMALALAVPTAICLPLTFPRGRRITAGIVSAAVLLLVGAGLFAALLTA